MGFIQSRHSLPVLEAGPDYASMAFFLPNQTDPQEFCTLPFHGLDSSMEFTSADSLRQFVTGFMQNNGLRTRKIAVVLKSSRSVIRLGELPPMGDKEMSLAMKQNIGNFFPIPIDSYETDYTVLERQNDRIRLMFGGIPKEVPLALTDMLIQWKLRPLGIYLYQQAAAMFLTGQTGGDFAVVIGFPEKIHCITLSESVVKTVRDFLFTNQEDCLAQIGRYLDTTGFAVQKVFLLDCPEWMHGFFQNQRMEETICGDRTLAMKGIIRGGFA